MAAVQNKALSVNESLEEAGYSFIVWLVIIFILVVLTGFGWWASKMTVDEVATASGVIIPGAHAYRVQSEISGRVERIYVKEGDRVEKGELLLKIDSREFEIDLEVQKGRENFLYSRKKRLEALLGGSGFQADENTELAALRESLYDVLNEKDKAEVQSILDEMAVLDNLLKKDEIKLDGMKKELALLDEELNMRRKLVSQGLNSRILMLSLERRRQEMQSEFEQIPIDIKDKKLKLSEVKSRAKRILLEQRRRYLSELENLLEDLEQTKRQMLKSLEMVLKSNVMAVYSGVVHALDVRAAGEYVRQGFSMMEIVPEAPRYLAEIKIKPEDIGHVKTGQRVTVKLATYHFGRYGGIDGELVEISPTSYLDQGMAHYKGVVSLEKNYIGSDPQKYQILPGMLLNADIRTGGKTVLEYLLKPVYASARQALRER
jgi:HlyD family secretion protein/adhesin transport system membrane fusion protein